MLGLIAFSPLVLVFILLVFFKWPAARAMPVALFVTIVIAAIFWQMPEIRILAAIIEGLTIAVKIL